jgi:hypothetical protein
MSKRFEITWISDSTACSLCTIFLYHAHAIVKKAARRSSLLKFTKNIIYYLKTASWQRNVSSQTHYISITLYFDEEIRFHST